MPEAAENEQQRPDRMHDVRNLHRAARLVEIRKIKYEARGPDDEAQYRQTAPEPGFLAGIEAV